jgi:signal transduction histidine kinase/DNA-binding response OmpR family regulator
VIGWPAGALTEVGLALLLISVARPGGLLPYLGDAVAGIVAGGAFTFLVGWAICRTLLRACQWSLYSYGQARQQLDAAQEQRIELKQTQDDLVLLNKELVRLYDELSATQELADEARRAKEQFVASVSHELRTPLNMIIGFSEMITDAPYLYGARLPSSLLADIAAIHRNGQHLVKLVDDVLDLSQVEAGRMALRKDWSSPQQIARDSVDAIRALFVSKGLALEADVPDELPSVFCDETRVRQIMLNLLSNAGRFTTRGGVVLRLRAVADELVVSVSDTGTGISPEDQKRLFEPFRQLSLAGRQDGGSGLGLSISKQFVELHGGKMWVESQVGVGTTVSFSLPTSPTAETAFARDSGAARWFSENQRYEARTRPSRAPVPVVEPRIVVLEKGDALCRLLSRYLDGVRLVTVADAGEAIRTARESAPQALVVNTPPRSNVLTQLLGSAGQPPDVPIIACWVPGEETAAEELGVRQYLTKPVTRTQLVSALQRIGDTRSVLLVDDEPEVLQLFTRMLTTSDHHYRIQQTTNGQRALDLLRKHHPDAMVLDLIMPEMDGLRLLLEKSRDQQIRDIPVIAVSSRDPASQPIISDGLVVQVGRRLSAQDLLACIEGLIGVLSPHAPRGRRAHQEAGVE